MLDNRGEETEDAEGDKTQSENQCGMDMFVAPAHAKFFHQDIPEFGDTEPEPDQREAGANPRHKSSVGRLAGALLGEFIRDLRALRKLVHFRWYPFKGKIINPSGCACLYPMGPTEGEPLTEPGH